MSYVTKAELVDFLNFVNPDHTVVVGDIDDATYNMTADFIAREIDKTYSDSERTLYLNGEGNKHIFVPDIPIISLTSITIIKKDETTVDVVLTGSTRQVWWDTETGQIEIITHIDGLDDVFSANPSEFPIGLRNVKIVGTFVGAAPDTAKYLQMLLYLKHLCMFDKANYNLDLIMERIGRYEYRVGVPSNQALQNQYKGIDGLIEWYLASLKEGDIYSIGIV